MKTFHDSFIGKIYAIKPGGEKIGEFPDVDVYERVTDVPDDEPVDFAFIEVPREHVPQVIGDCAAKGVKLASIYSSGFADAGTDEGRDLQEEVLQAASGTTRLLGPNGMGLYYPRLGIRWRPSLPQVYGTVGLIVQSGGLCNLLIHGLAAEGLPISKAFSIGNAADINAIDVLSYFKDDPETSVIVVYLEGLPAGRGRQFMDVLSSCEKPVIFVKGGKTAAGSRAVRSHTATVAGVSEIWTAVVRQVGGIPAETFDDIVSAVKFLKAVGQVPIGNACMLTLSGGYAVICSDVLTGHGIVIADFSNQVREALAGILNSVGTSINNPIDIGGFIYDVDKIEAILDIVLEDGGIDGVIFEITPVYIAAQMRGDSLGVELAPMLDRVKQRHRKPILSIVENVGYDDIKHDLKRDLTALGIPVYDDIMQVARTLKSINGSKTRSPPTA